MNLLPISNRGISTEISTERALRLAIIGDDQLKTDFVKSLLNISDSNFILLLYVTTFKSNLIEWVNIPTNCPLELIITLLKNVSGMIYASESNSLLDNILSHKTMKILRVAHRPSWFSKFPNDVQETCIILDDPNALSQNKNVLHNFIESLNFKE